MVEYLLGLLPVIGRVNVVGYNAVNGRKTVTTVLKENGAAIRVVRQKNKGTSPIPWRSELIAVYFVLPTGERLLQAEVTTDLKYGPSSNETFHLRNLQSKSHVWLFCSLKTWLRGEGSGMFFGGNLSKEEKVLL